ncbi:MAG: lipid-binding SYLF domain-containing protein, partial [Terriglobia bacterium]
MSLVMAGLTMLLAGTLFVQIPIRANAADPAEQQQLVEKATLTFDRFLSDRTTKAWYRKEGRKVTAVFIVPQFLRGAFLVGAAGGTGVLLARDLVKGGWSPPSFYRMSTASIGAQAGADSSEVVLLVLTQAGLERFHGTGTFRLGL